MDKKLKIINMFKIKLIYRNCKNISKMNFLKMKICKINKDNKILLLFLINLGKTIILFKKIKIKILNKCRIIKINVTIKNLKIHKMNFKL